MSDFVPVNDLDRAIMAMQKSKAAMPDFCRHLSEGELWVPVQYHPELADGGAVPIQNGSPIPFALLQRNDGKTYVPLFSSEGRYEEGLAKAKVPPNTYLPADMPAKQLLEILGKADLWAEINNGCETGSMFIGPELMRDLANGKALEPTGTEGEEVEAAMKIVDPADYPTDLLQPVYEKLRQHRQFRVAWLFTEMPDAVKPGQPPLYYFLVVMDKWDEVLFHEFNMVVAAASGSKYRFSLMPSTEADHASITILVETGPPFYAASDYQPPPKKTADQ